VAGSAANSKPKGKPRGKPWPKGTSGNPAGAPKRGESWAEIIKRVGDLTPSEAAEAALLLAKDLLKLGDGVTLKQAAVMSMFRQSINDPQPGLLNILIERAEGKVATPLEIRDWRAEAAEAGFDPDKIIETVFGEAPPHD
jgi:hypothetical protein